MERLRRESFKQIIPPKNWVKKKGKKTNEEEMKRGNDFWNKL
jgi:hypothetical protein